MLYFTPFSGILAATASRSVSAGLDTLNRGAKQRRYAMVRHPQFTSILVESGFVTNRDEYLKLIHPAYQQEIARRIVSSVAAVIEHTYPGSGRRYG